MPKEDWGTKRLCTETGKRFYDLGRVPAVSPYTGKVVDIDTSKTSRTMVADKADKASVKKDEVVEDDLLETDDIEEDDAEVDLEDDVLEDDDDDDDVSLEDIADVAAPDDD
jgi:uncharacterized protein (TIGR02300 family)